MVGYWARHLSESYREKGTMLYTDQYFVYDPTFARVCRRLSGTWLDMLLLEEHVKWWSPTPSASPSSSHPNPETSQKAFTTFRVIRFPTVPAGSVSIQDHPSIPSLRVFASSSTRKETIVRGGRGASGFNREAATQCVSWPGYYLGLQEFYYRSIVMSRNRGISFKPAVHLF